jgi:hypothetical protein
MVILYLASSLWDRRGYHTLLHAMVALVAPLRGIK